ncbi:hypothetical protein DFQ26_005223 [Actinomortierella ambigua]|nr:hypothetical protein DFQ26_005223 [Actinomortierella ambigua]
MRILPTLILSLVAAATVSAAPAPIPVTHDVSAEAAHLEKRGWVMDQLKPLFKKALDTLECGACVAALVGAKNIAVLNKNWVLDAAKGMCTDFKIMPGAVCEGLVDSYGPTLVDAVLKAKLMSGDGKYICFNVLGMCPRPGATSGSVKFPKPRPTNITMPKPSGELVDVLHLSDWHVDPQYEPGSEGDCGLPLCCRKYSFQPGGAIKRPASTWGDYGCDAPIKLGQDLLANGVYKVSNPAFSILTGDVPPHDVWNETIASVIEDHHVAYGAMKAGLKTPMYPAIGNHESHPPNLFPTQTSGGDASWLYKNLATEWNSWLPADATNSVRQFGAYTASPRPGLRVISLNTNFCYTLNFYLYANTKDHDPFGELNWLVRQLQAAEDAGERVWIIGHIAPGLTDCLENWSSQYHQVIQRYSPHVVAEQFFGHTHNDEFELFYNSNTKNAANAISTAWIGPSASPFTDLNPGFRLYKVDTKTWNVYDSSTYIANLQNAASWDATGATPDWHLEYSARQTYGAAVPIAANEPLSAGWWHNVTLAFEKDDALFQKYWLYHGKSAGLNAACNAASGCKAEIICNMRAGNSAQSCSEPSFSIKRDDAEDEAVAAADGGARHTLVRRAAPKPWNKKMCGISANL